MDRPDAPAKPKSAHPLRDLVEVVVFAVAMAIGLKVYALEAYQIPTGSMQPNLMGTKLLSEDHTGYRGAIHDRVLVDKLCYLLRDPQRWEVVVFRYPLVGHINYVKRLVGMPGEEIWIRHGDVYARPLGSDEDFRMQRKPPRVQDAVWKEAWLGNEPQAPSWDGWDLNREAQRRGDELLLSANGAAATRFSLKDDYRHGYPTSVARRIPTSDLHGRNRENTVSDIKVAAKLTPQTGAGLLRVELDAGPYEFRLQLDPQANQVRLQGPGGLHLERAFSLPAGAELQLEFGFWDHQIHLSLDGDQRFEHLQPLDLEPAPAVTNRVRFGVDAGAWAVAPPRLYRDIYYLPSGGPSHGTETGLFEIQDGHYFMLGDNTQTSHDSRSWLAQTVVAKEPIDGRREFRGDRFENGADPFYDNPRYSKDGQLMTFRDQWGEPHAIPLEQIETSEQAPAGLVPREYLLGKVLAVFLPIPPLSPVFRIKLVR